MGAIYEPRGPAREYSKLALSTYKGCDHHCDYCFAPCFAYRMKPAAIQKELFKKPTVIGSEKYTEEQRVVRLLKQVAREAKNFTTNYPDNPRVLLSFTSDPYQQCERKYRVTGQILKILAECKVPATVLTKNPALALELDAKVIAESGTHLATTIVWSQESSREKWESGAPSLESRYKALQKAKELGITTWVSIEPVIDAKEGLEVIRNLIGMTSLVKIGGIDKRWNKEVYDSVNWPEFLLEALRIVNIRHQNYYIKDHLWKHVNEDSKKFARSKGYEP